MTAHQAIATDIRIWRFEATIVSLDDPQSLYGDVRLGDTVHGDFAYDLDLPASTLGETWNDYDHPLGFQGIRVAIENPRNGEELRYEPHTEYGYLVTVFEDSPYSPGDSDSAVDFWQSSTPPLPGLSGLIFIDFSGVGVLNETSLPTDYNLEDWPVAAVYFGVLNDIIAQIYLVEPLLAGDFDQDGDVDANDRDQWEGDYNMSGDSDADRDADSDGADFLAWQRHFAVSASTTKVPEPSTGIILVLGMVTLLAGRRTAVPKLIDSGVYDGPRQGAGPHFLPPSAALQLGWTESAAVR